MSAVSIPLALLIAFGRTPALAQDDAQVNDTQANDITPYDFASIDQIAPTSPVAGGNDPNGSDEVLYVVESNQEDSDEILEDEEGILKTKPKQKKTVVKKLPGPKPHFFVNPSARVAAKLALSKRLTMEVFILGGASDFRQNTLPLATRATNISGGINTNVDFGLANGVFAYEHRDAYADRFGAWKSTGDKVGATFNKTLPFFIRDLTITPQLLTSRDMVNPLRLSTINVEATAGLTYNVTPKISFAASAGYAAVFLYGLPGYRHDNGLKALVGANYKPTENLLLSLGATTNRTALLGLPRYRVDASLSPSASFRYTLAKYLTFNVAANYGRYISTLSGQGTFKYNVNPAIALNIPL